MAWISPGGHLQPRFSASRVATLVFRAFETSVDGKVHVHFPWTMIQPTTSAGQSQEDGVGRAKCNQSWVRCSLLDALL